MIHRMMSSQTIHRHQLLCGQCVVAIAWVLMGLHLIFFPPVSLEALLHRAPQEAQVVVQLLGREVALQVPRLSHPDCPGDPVGLPLDLPMLVFGLLEGEILWLCWPLPWLVPRPI